MSAKELNQTGNCKYIQMYKNKQEYEWLKVLKLLWALVWTTSVDFINLIFEKWFIYKMYFMIG